MRPLRMTFATVRYHVLIIVGLLTLLYTSYHINLMIIRFLMSKPLSDGIATVSNNITIQSNVIDDKNITIEQVNLAVSDQKQQTQPSAINSHQTTSPDVANFSANGVPISDLYKPGHLKSNRKLCGSDAGEHMRLLILITSAPSNHDARLAIRQTWGSYASRRDIAIAFVIDSYYNLTLKSITKLEWVETYCSRVAYILKADDDMFVNVLRFMSWIEDHPPEQQQKNIFGSVCYGFAPFRDKESKYYVSEQEYFPSSYPDFIASMYLISGSTIHDLYTTALKQIFFKLEDVFMTGIVAELVNIERINVDNFREDGTSRLDMCNLREKFVIHDIKINEQFDLWEKLMNTSANCELF
ncbi:beta-1,3-galactosyltransferase 5-like [Sitodiplosis mosellana]|uniref:beta-1,3-galactosyltransferase 5-like n=1 Tax=Sitodiplosis mosellana TaxID=263140 RepID=UPI002443D979|nr:beta-1,3-galactosyltransferase 5-like [Sitodiplosis mosellana]